MRTAPRTAGLIPRDPVVGRRSRPVTGTLGDHAAIEDFLASVAQQPASREFHAQLEDPFYEPSDRILVKVASQLVGHIRHSARTMCFGASRWPLGRLSYLAVLPEYRPRGVPAQLLRSAEDHMLEAGTLLAEFDTRDWHLATQAGWLEGSGMVFSQASPRDILSQLAWRGELIRAGSLLAGVRRRSRMLSVRHWRHVELPALMRIYRANLGTSYGALERTESYWKWLIGRRAFDQISIVLEGPDHLALEEDDCRIVGYAVAKDHQILELMTEPGHATAAFELLGRACADAIEQDHHTLQFHAPPRHELHKLIQEAGGSYHAYQAPRGTATFIKLPQPSDLIERLTDEMFVRARASHLRLPAELGLLVDGKKWQLTLGDDTVKLVRNKLGRSYVTCDAACLSRLILGYDAAETAIASGWLESSTTLAETVATALFPGSLMWRPPWDHTPA